MGGVTADPITGTVLIYAGLAVVGVGSVLWLWLAFRPLWRRPGRPALPVSFRLTSYREVYKGNLHTAQVTLRCRRRVTLERVRVQCSAPTEDIAGTCYVYREHDLMPPSYQLKRTQPTTAAATYDLTCPVPVLLLPRRSQIDIYVQSRNAISIERVWVRNRWWRF